MTDLNTPDPNTPYTTPGTPPPPTEPDGAAKALKAEREARKAAEKSAKDATDRLEQIEADRLIAEGKHKERADKSEAELKALKAEKQANEFKDSVRRTFSESGIGNLSDPALTLRSAQTADDMLETAKAIKAEIDKQVEAEVTKRLETGGRPQGGGGGNMEVKAGRFEYPSMQKK